MQPRLSHCLSVTLLALAPLFCSPHPVAEQAGSAHRPFHGTATWFLPNLGACGEVSSEADHIIAMNTPQYKSGGHCHKNVVIKNKANGKSVVAKVLDEVRLSPVVRYWPYITVRGKIPLSGESL
ncbi:hypothetical protein PCASD_22818 [Puccinia coronata f. sp. avenae]|uniref:RlpA-like protein double-psi beta-barrel domain-containing protein n=1 Tax=Puccinia coronata f. sp. avenae TaxID=200324 RepID=A0A2N5S365_9BASI|nr:hypothetical protein PCASD_22818 [Puccinia coronata f. sp. avenae]